MFTSSAAESLLKLTPQSMSIPPFSVPMKVELPLLELKRGYILAIYDSPFLKLSAYLVYLSTLTSFFYLISEGSYLITELISKCEILVFTCSLTLFNKLHDLSRDVG